MKGLKKALVTKAISAKTNNLKNGEYTSGLWDKLVFNKMKQALGGRVRIMFTGSAPIDN